MSKRIKVRRSRKDRERYVDEWLKENNLTRDRVQAQAHLDGIGHLSLDDYYAMAVGHNREAG